MVEQEHTKGERIMLNDFEDVNRILAEMTDDGMIEPIDDPALEVNFWDWADVMGMVEEFEPEEMVDEDGEVWYVS
jgi:hypothetical protein